MYMRNTMWSRTVKEDIVHHFTTLLLHTPPNKALFRANLKPNCVRPKNGPSVFPWMS